MLSEQQQRIMGYFIEEAKDHLNTLEQGLLNLQVTIADPELVSEVFRAAHSVKGGAAMLGLDSIQQTAHRLEDYFKILKECPIKVDQKLESLCLRVFDTLQELLEQLQGPFGLTDDKASEVMAEVEPVFGELSAHMSYLVSQSGSIPPEDVELSHQSAPVKTPTAKTPAVNAEESALRLVFQSDVPARLREMLQQFKQADSVDRHQLQETCRILSRMGEQFDLPAWSALLETAQRAIANSDNTYRTLAPILIKDIKQAQELVLAGRAAEIVASQELDRLAPQPVPVEADFAGLDFADLLSLNEADEAAPELFDFVADFEDEADQSLSLDLDTAIDDLADDSWLTDTTTPFDASSEQGLDALTAASSSASPDDFDRPSEKAERAANRHGPEVGMAELNSLADLFEGEMPDLSITWQEEAIDEPGDSLSESLDLDAANDFSDLLLDQDVPPLVPTETEADEDLSGLLHRSEFADAAVSDPRDELSDLLNSDLSTADGDFNDLDFSEFTFTDAPSPTVSEASLEVLSETSDGFDGLSELFEGLDEGEASTADDLGSAQNDFGSFDSFDSNQDNLDALFGTPAVDGPLEQSLEQNTGDELLLAETEEEPIAVHNTSGWNDQDDVVADLWNESDEAADIEPTPLGGLDDALFEPDPAPETVLPLEIESEAIAFDLIPDLEEFDDSEEYENLFDAALAQTADEVSGEALGEALTSTETSTDDFDWMTDPFGNADEPEARSSASLDFDDLDSLDELDLDNLDNLANLESLDNLDSPNWERTGSFDETILPSDGEQTVSADFHLFGDEADTDASETDGLEGLDVNLGDLFDEETSASALEGDWSDPSTAADMTEEIELPALSEADLSAANLFDADLSESNLAEADLSATDLSDIDLGEELGAIFDFDEEPLADSLSAAELEGAIAQSEEPIAASELDDLDLEGDWFGDESDSETDDTWSSLVETQPEISLSSSPDPTAFDSADLEASSLDFNISDLEAADLESDLGFDFNLETEIPDLANDSVSPVLSFDVEAAIGSAALDEINNLGSDEDLDFDLMLNQTPNLTVGETDFGLGLDEAENLDDLMLDFDEVNPADSQTSLDLDDFNSDIFGSDADDQAAFEALDAADSGESNSETSEDWSNLNALLSGETSLFDAAEETSLFDAPELNASVETDIADTASDLDTDALDGLDSLWDGEALDGTEDLSGSGSNAFDADSDAFDLDALLGEDEAVFEVPVTEAIATDEDDFGDFGDFGDLDALLEEDITASSQSQATATSEDDFGDLDALLEEDIATEASSSDIADLNNFADLDALLGDESSDLLSGGLPAAESAAEDDFADLEALLGDETLAVRPIATPAQSAQASVTSEFDDLERLLEDADQTLGGPPTARGVRRPSLTPKKRSPGVLSDQNMRVSVKNLDNLNNLVGELVVNRNSLEQTQERLRQFLDNLLYQVQQLSDVGQRMRDLYERSLLESSLLSSRKSYQLSSQGSGGAAAQVNHSTGMSFDALEMDRFTGFHTLSQEMIELIVRVRESASDIDFVVDESDQITRMFRQVTTQLQEGLTRSRMVPFDQTAARLPRAVRDISVKCGKQAELAIEGKETLIDKMILEQLYDPMTHLVNNAITHGIETPEERQGSGKTATGRITVRAFHQGNQTVISVTDDGAGINPEVVKRKAVEKGLITAAEAREMARLDVYDLLFHHGFSTRDKADDFAGRGVGMDVVRTSLNEIRGSINIDSTVGKGTTFTIRLPLTLSISKALCCISNRARIAFPMDGVEDMFDVPKERVQTDAEGRPCISWRDSLLPFQPLSELLKYSRSLGRGSVYGGNQEEDIISVVVLRSNAGSYLALQVDQVLGEQEIVIKQLEGPVPKPVGVAGATVLGDGRIMPIADVLELIDLSLGRIRREPGSSLWEKADDRPPVEVDSKTDPTVLIVDDSITVRELLSMTFNKVGYRVEQARDGQEAWEKLRAGLPCDIVFCDIEMPRMDGLELLSRLQKDPNLSELPIAMLTSRGADRHRQMAVQLGAKGYFTKPYLEEALLDAAQRMLKGEVLVS